MILLVLIGYFVYKNGQIAKEKGKNIFIWSLLTIVAVFITMLIGMLLLMVVFYPSYLGVADVSKSQELANAISTNVLQSLYLFFCGIGGYLLIRYILERSKTDSNTGTGSAVDDL